MALDEATATFLADHHQAAMITVGADGYPKAVRVGVVLVDGKLWSSGTRDRVRTARVRHDPRCTLFVFDPGFASLTLEATVTVLDGLDAPELSVQLFRAMQNRPTGALSWYGRELDQDAFRQAMVDEGRLIYEFNVHRVYGMA